jgi:hypothetical protein
MGHQANRLLFEPTVAERSALGAVNQLDQRGDARSPLRAKTVERQRSCGRQIWLRSSA